MIKKTKIILAIWCLVIVILVGLTFIFTSDGKVNNQTYDKMIEASNLAKEAMDEIKNYKIELGLGISDTDILETGMIGSSKRTPITTTEGVLEAKRTTCNPEWAAAVIKAFEKAGIKEGDEVGMIFSGSFPALNICVMAACQTYNLKTCIMGSIGASYHGANQLDCTFIDMANHLYEKGIFNKTLDYVSLGGADDICIDIHSEELRQSIITELQNGNIPFIYEENLKENVNKRLEYLKNDVPNMKLFINCGGTIVAYGEGVYAFSETGYFKGNKRAWTYNEVINRKNGKYGLIQCVKLLGVDIFSMKDIKTLSESYGLPYDPSKMPEIGTSDVFYETKYKMVFPIIGIVLSIAIGGYLFYLKKKKRLE